MKTILSAAIMAAGLTALPSGAMAETFKSRYAISAIGLRIGSSDFETRVTGNAYTVTGSLKAAGVASLFSSMKGQLTATGSLDTDTVRPKQFDVVYSEDGKNKSTAIRFGKGNVASAVNKPAKKPNADWVALKPGDLQSVLDPIAAMMVRAASPAEVCGRTMRVFDGVLRADFKTSFVRTIPFSTRGYKGEAVTCRLSFNPIGGYEPTKKDIIFMRDKSRIEVSFAPVGNSGFFAPVAARASTRIGMVNMRATRFEVID